MNQLKIIESKIYENFNSDDLNRKLAFLRFKSKKVVFTNGCFDVLHRGHIEYLAKASDMGDFLIIGLNTDKSVKRLKGNNRPINNEYDRALLLSALQYVSAVVYFHEDTPYNLINHIQPDVLVKGGDYNLKDIVGYDIVKNKKGEIAIINFVEGYSSSSVINKF